MRVVVAMSGGVDSSVAALLLREAGHDVSGVFLRNGVAARAGEGPVKGCCSVRDACDAQEVAGLLGIPFYSLDHSREFSQIVSAFVDAYAQGETPNPCVQCNRDLKLGELLRFAQAIGAEAVATGHYARVETVGQDVELRRGVDHGKDQSYVLATVRSTALQRALFPVGGLAKAEVRETAERAGLPVFGKPESQDICFVPTGDYRDVLRERRPDLFRPGQIVAEDGTPLGEHSGAAGFTVGQRKGLGLGGDGPYFVVRTEPEANRVVVGRRDALVESRWRLRTVNWLRQPAGDRELAAELQVRAHAPTVPVFARGESDDRLRLRVPEGVVGAPGQIGVLYDGDRVICAGTLTRAAEPAAAPPSA